MSANRCTCQSGRDTDGSEFGPCEWCEGAEAREHDETFAEPPEAEIIICRCGMRGSWPDVGEDGCWACDMRSNAR